MYVVHSPLTYCVLFHPRGIALWPAVFSTKSGSACTEIRWDSSVCVPRTFDFRLQPLLQHRTIISVPRPIDSSWELSAHHRALQSCSLCGLRWVGAILHYS